MLRDTIEFLVERLACAERRLMGAHIRKPYSLAERLHILWCIEYFGIPRRQVPKCFGVARSVVSRRASMTHPEAESAWKLDPLQTTAGGTRRGIQRPR